MARLSVPVVVVTALAAASSFQLPLRTPTHQPQLRTEAARPPAVWCRLKVVGVRSRMRMAAAAVDEEDDTAGDFVLVFGFVAAFTAALILRPFAAAVPRRRSKTPPGARWSSRIQVA